MARVIGYLVLVAVVLAAIFGIAEYMDWIPWPSDRPEIIRKMEIPFTPSASGETWNYTSNPADPDEAVRPSPGLRRFIVSRVLKLKGGEGLEAKEMLISMPDKAKWNREHKAYWKVRIQVTGKKFTLPATQKLPPQDRLVYAVPAGATPVAPPGDEVKQAFVLYFGTGRGLDSFIRTHLMGAETEEEGTEFDAADFDFD